MIVGVCGFGFTGSGAIIDLLKEYPSVIVSDSLEFSLLYKPDGIETLKNAIVDNPSRHFSSDSAIRRFIHYMQVSRKQYNACTNGIFDSAVEKYLKKIIQVKWSGSTAMHVYQTSSLDYLLFQRIGRRVREAYEKKFGMIKHSAIPDIDMYYSYMDENSFYEASKEFVKTIVCALAGKAEIGTKDIVVLDQVFSASAPQNEFPYFDNPKAIVVYRDPRDLYVLANEAFGLSGRFIPYQKVDDFIKYYRGLMKSSVVKNGENILVVMFEDLVYQYNQTVDAIETFLGLENNDKRSRTYFNPDVSINNTQVYVKYPQYRDDIRQIENELGEYLYDFSRFEKKPHYDIKSF